MKESRRRCGYVAKSWESLARPTEDLVEAAVGEPADGDEKDVPNVVDRVAAQLAVLPHILDDMHYSASADAAREASPPDV